MKELHQRSFSSRQSHNDVVVVAHIGRRLHILGTLCPGDHGTGAIHDLQPLRPGLQSQHHARVHTRVRREGSDLLVVAVHVDLEALSVLRKEDGVVDRVLGVLPAGGLVRAVRGGQNRSVPHRASGALSGWRVELRDVRVTGLVCLDEGREKLLPTLVVEAVGVFSNVAAGELLWPEVSDIVALTSVVPRDDLDEVRLQFENLFDPLRVVEFTNAVPILAIQILELER